MAKKYLKQRKVASNIPSEYPEKLYKYFKFDQYENLEHLFENKEVYFCAPDFNDPYDCKININLPKTLKEKQAFSKRMASQNKKRLKTDYNTEFKKFFSNFKDKNLLKP